MFRAIIKRFEVFLPFSYNVQIVQLQHLVEMIVLTPNRKLLWLYETNVNTKLISFIDVLMMPPTLYTTIPMNAPLPGANPTCTWIPQQQGGVSTALNTACAAPYQPPMLYPDMVNVAVGQVGQAVVPPASTSPMKPMYHMSVTMW